MDVTELREEIQRLVLRLDGQPQWPELRAVYLEMATLLGRLQGAVSDVARQTEDTHAIQPANDALALLKASVRQVGLDIRLASESALTIGLQSALQQAEHTLDLLTEIITSEV